jgi:alpha-ketoglutarate-dependent taurine dioxygenase
MIDTKRPSLHSFSAVKPRSVALSRAALVKTGRVDAAQGFPVLVEPGLPGLNLAAWAAANRGWIEERLLAAGAILFRGFNVHGAEQFREVARSATPELLDYQERAAPRNAVGRNVYTSTEFPANQIIPLHHEMSYSHNWPARLWFYCEVAPAAGGRTPVADDRQVYRSLDPRIRQRFRDRRVMYVRNYGEGVDMSWQEAFQTADRAQVEEYCRRALMTVEWKSGDRLRTRAVRQGVLADPRTGEELWFNHAHMFHVSNLEPAVRESLLAEFAADELPRNAFYGDGSAIEAGVLEEIRGRYEERAVRFEWQQGDLLLVDNFLVTHGREAFAGPRKILVAMADLFDSTRGAAATAAVAAGGWM